MLDGDIDPAIANDLRDLGIPPYDDGLGAPRAIVNGLIATAAWAVVAGLFRLFW